MKRNVDAWRGLVSAGLVLSLVSLPIAATSAERVSSVTLHAADPSKPGDGTMSPAAAAALAFGVLARSAAEADAKERLTRASDNEAAGDAADAEEAPAARRVPVIHGGHAFVGQFNNNATPPNVTGAIGTTRYIQAVNRRFGIYNRASHAVISQGTLSQLAGVAASVVTFNPQIIWDPQTTKYFYVANSNFSATDHRLAYGFSKTASPSSPADFCHYTINYGIEFPDQPKLGDSQFFAIIGVNAFANGFLGSDIMGISKPGAGNIGACPAFSTFKFGIRYTLRDTTGEAVFAPVPANAIDTNATGFVIARSGELPSNRLWFFNVVRAANGNPLFGNARGLVVSPYSAPPDAPADAGSNRKLDTLDARNTQAVLAINPDRGATALSFWTQHTVKHPTQPRSIVRWYEINPSPAVPTIRRSTTIGTTPAGIFAFNAAISPDRRVAGAVRQFGDSFVIGYNVTRKTAPAINPRINMASSFSGGALSFATVRNSTGPYADFSCKPATSTCRWGSYAAATPDPSPGAAGRGVVWSTNQFASGATNTANANWRTFIFAARP